MYHFVWIPKYRHKVFTDPYRESLKAIIEKIRYDIDIEELEVPEDHIHMVVRGVLKMSPKCNAGCKEQICARIFPYLSGGKKTLFWGGKLWTQSYFVETIGNANEEVIRAYAQNQLLEYDKKESRSSQLNLF
jgi:putative transposase